MRRAECLTPGREERSGAHFGWQTHGMVAWFRLTVKLYCMTSIVRTRACKSRRRNGLAGVDNPVIGESEFKLKVESPKQTLGTWKSNEAKSKIAPGMAKNPTKRNGFSTREPQEARPSPLGNGWKSATDSNRRRAFRGRKECI